MDEKNIIRIVQQYLFESGHSDSLKEFQRESGYKFSEKDWTKGGELIWRMTEHYDSELLKEMQDLATGKDYHMIHELEASSLAPHISHLVQEIQNVHSRNILCVRFDRFSESPLRVWTGGVDGKLIRTNLETKEKDMEMDGFNSPILEIGLHPSTPTWLVVSVMSGHVFVVDTRDQSFKSEKISQKYCNRCRFHPDGDKFAVSSFDGTVHLFSFNIEDGSFTLTRTFTFDDVVESMVFTPDGSYLIASVRQDHRLVYVKLKDMEITRVNMNANGDDVCSFNVIDMFVDTSSRTLTVATDKSRLIMFAVGTGQQLRNYYGCPNEEYTMCRCAVDRSIDYVYCIGEDRKIYVWDAATQMIVDKLASAKNVVRDLDYWPEKELLASVSFDKTLRVFSTLKRSDSSKKVEKKTEDRDGDGDGDGDDKGKDEEKME
eukprot:TRINITY_DN68872_c0_g1_i1.p1 TRINITY_DN68872_c0_g1~~TRINITY_DN68872_c0_g1_i1.p1  ORF type:complete len:464 (-),score=148.73 TRINITY_DN68872_c0_g1_i1:893-2185(-)